MLIQGNLMDEARLLLELAKAKNDETCRSLDIREVDFDYEPAQAFVRAIKEKRQKWDSIKITFCQGFINDVITACMSNENVKDFSLQAPMINSQTIFSLSYGLKYSSSLESLSLSITLTYETANSLAKALARNSYLKSLNLSGSTFEPLAIGPVGLAFRLNRTLERFNLDACYLEDDQVASLLFAIQDHPSLKTLSLQQNLCHDEGMAAVAALLHYNDLEELDLSYLIRQKKKAKQTETLPVKEEEEEEEEEEQTEEIDVTSEEKEDDEDETKEEEETKDDIDSETKSDVDGGDKEKEEPKEEKEETKESEVKVQNRSLKVLQLAGNGLSDDFMDSILGIFGEGSALEQLNFFGNRISDAGVRTIVRKIPYFKHLKSLWLGQNNFSLLAGKCLVETMRQNFILEDVNIRNLTSNPQWDQVQSDLDHYAKLNRGGRRIFASDPSQVPLGLWSLVIERANRIFWQGSVFWEGNLSSQRESSHAADAIFCLLHGPVLFANPNLPSTR